MPRKARAALALIAVVLLAVLTANGAGSSSRPGTWASPTESTAGTATVTPSPARVPHYDQALEWPLAYFQASSLWAYTEGAGVRVAVVDTGVALRQPDLAGAVIKVVDLTPGPPGDESSRSHGTAVAGLIAGRGSPTAPKRMAGLAPRALLIDVRIARQVADVSTADIANGIIAAVKARAMIINVSLGTPKDDRQLDRAVGFAVKHGCLVVASAGVGSAPVYPAASPEVLAVAAVRKNLVPMTSLALYQPWAMYAPGQDLYSTAETGYLTGIKGNDYATAYVSAAAALVWSRALGLGASGTRQLLVRAASQTAAGSGPGILDPLAAVRESQPASVTPGPTVASGPTPTQQQRRTARAPAAASGSGLRSAVIAVPAALAIIALLLVIVWLFKGRPGRRRGRPGHIPGSLDVHF